MNVFELNGMVDSYGYNTNWVKWNLKKFSGQEVTMRINSLGGAVNEAMAIADAIKQHGKVTAVLVGCNASAATWMCLSANKVQIQKDAMWMCHKSASLVDICKAAKADEIDNIITQLQNQKKSNEAFDLQIAKMYAARTSKTLEDVVQLMSEERWMPASEVKEWGFVDEIIDGAIPLSNYAKELLLQNCATLNLPTPTFSNDAEDHTEENLFARVKNYLKDAFGLEPKAKDEAPAEPTSNEGAAPKEDDPNNPINNPQTENKGMKKILNSVVCLLALLNLKEIEATDEQVTLNVDQMNSIENALAEAKTSKAELTAVNEVLDGISDEIKNIEGTKNKVQALKMLLNHAPAVAPAGAYKTEEPGVVNDGADEVNKFFD